MAKADERNVAVMRMLGHIQSAQVVQTANVDISVVGDNTIYTTPGSKRFVVYQLYLQNQNAALTAFTIKSGANVIGTHRLEIVATLNSILILWNSGLPVLVGRADGEDLIINVSAPNPPTLTGYASIGFIDVS